MQHDQEHHRNCIALIPIAGVLHSASALTARLLKGWLYVDSLKAGGTSVHVLLPRYAGTTPGDAPG